MNADFGESVLRVTSDYLENEQFGKAFGTAFVIDRDGHGTYLLTCRHVVTAVGGADRVRVDGHPATVVVSGSEDGPDDLAVLLVEALRDVPILRLNICAETGSLVKVLGFQSYFSDSPQTLLIRPLQAQLGEQVGLEARQKPGRVEAWDLAIEGNYDLEQGYSGGPIIAEKSGDVIGIANVRLGGKKGVAISVEALGGISEEYGRLLNVHARSHEKQIHGDKLELSEISPLPDTGSSFVGREENLRQLDHAWYESDADGPDINIVSLVAAGGVGKSALINEWLSRLGEHKGGADKVFIWSFADQGVTERVVSADSFLEAALKFFGETDPYRGTQVGKGQRLAACIQDPQKHQKPLLILDGLEPFQHPPANESGKLKNDSLKTLLIGLAELNPGLCVISTRLGIADLTRFEGKSHLSIDLENLSDQAGADLLKSRGIKGSQEELESASRYYGGHALALTLLASYLELFDGVVHQRENVSLLAEDKEHGWRWRAVMQAYESWFEDEGTEELGWACLAVWRLFGLFERPVDEKFLREEFLGSDPIPGLTDSIEDLHLDEHLDVWRRIIRRLSRADLLSVNRTPGKPEGVWEFDAHALIREYFSEQLEGSSSEAWREGNERLADLYVERYKDAAEESPTIKDMDPLFQAIVHACKADRYHEALYQIYLPHIMRGEDEAYAESKLGALGDLISVLSRFFKAGEWGKPVPNLSESDQLLVLTDAGRYLTQTRGYASPEVGACYETAKTLSDEKGDPRRFFEARLGRSRFLRVGGQLTKTDRENQQMLEAYENLDQHTQDILRPTVYSAVQRALATNYFYMGVFAKANEYASEGAAILEQVSVPMRSKERKEALKRARLDVNEPSILCLSYQAAALWLLGEPDRALRTSAGAVHRAVDLDHAHTLAIALLLDGMVKHFSDDPVATKESARWLSEHCETFGFPLWRVSGEILDNWASARIERDEQSKLDEVIENLIASWEKDFTAKLFTSYWYALLAETRLSEHKYESGLEAVARGLKSSDDTGEHWWDAELYRLKGELMLLHTQDPKEAEKCFRDALERAKDQEAKSLQLRAAMSLARVRRQHERKEDARSDLAEVYRSFDKGIETKDLKEAKQLMDELL